MERRAISDDMTCTFATIAAKLQRGEIGIENNAITNLANHFLFRGI
jgi:hypothetical protein